MRVDLLPLGRSLDVNPGASLETILADHGVEFPCGGAGICRGCRVRVRQGDIPVTAEMREAFTPAELAAGWRLGCCSRVESPVVLEVDQWAMPILADDSRIVHEPCEGVGIAIDLGTTTLVAQAIDLMTAEVLAVESALNPQSAYGADVMSRIEFALAAGAHSAPNRDSSAPNRDPSAPTRDPSAPTRDPSAPNRDPSAPSRDASAPNRAAPSRDRKGADPSAPNRDPSAPSRDPSAPSRDPSAPSRDRKGAELTTIIRAALGELIARLPARDRTRQVILAGNTAMHHLFCGIDVQPLSSVPFQPVNDGEQIFRAAELGWNLPESATIRFLPCLGGFVGSDILAGILATGIDGSQAPRALIDLGTNGEIVVGNKNRILCASTAAGPAFEAGRIRMGMRAATGAIAHVTISNGKPICRTIGDVPPRGICGSGLVDAVAAALELGAVQPSGRLTAGDFALAGNVSITQSDIRELQLAKAAIAAGLRILLKRWGAAAEDLEAVYLAGAFGNYVNIASAGSIGLLEVQPDRIIPSGNTALRGVKMTLLCPRRPIRVQAEHVPLASDPGFQDAFVECMSLGSGADPSGLRGSLDPPVASDR